jgi:8-oxo-dGTP diphosphatase
VFPAVPLLLVRHAKAGSRGDWTADDRLRPLSRSGQKQAELLVEQLAPFAVTRILSSPYVRCTQTMEPLSRALGLELEVSEKLAEGRPAKALALVRKLIGGPTVALCTHGDIVPALLEALADEGASFGPPLEWSKGSTWVLHCDGDRVTGGEYLRPPL